MPVVRLYHNPRCIESQEALARQRERGVEPELINYSELPPNRAELEGLSA